MSAVKLAPEASAGIRAAQDALEHQATRLAVGDPTASVLSAFAAVLGAQHRLAVDASLKGQAQQEAVAQLIQDGRKPWSRDEMRALVTQLDQTLMHRWSQFNRTALPLA